MTPHRPPHVALALALALFAPGLLAGEIVLFDGENFQGNRAVYNDTAPNLDGTRFNDRTASISVRDGTWEVCFHINFEGGCMPLAPGDYPRLDPPFNRSISSLRLINDTAYGGSYPTANEITLFDGENFQGDRAVYGDTAPNLDSARFNDRTASISVRGGPWEVCYHINFEGGCMQLAPGDYPRLDPPFDRSISSVRPLGGAVYGGNYPEPPPQESPGIGLPGLNIGIDLPQYPELVPVPGYPVYYAPQVNSNYFFYDGMYWVYQQDRWYASSWYNGPWGIVAPQAVPLFVLRVPVGYYRRPPAYFRGWSWAAPPRWGEHWGNAWAQSHRGWENWNRNAAPAPAPLPLYQRQYSGNRYPRAEQQQSLQRQNYRYQPRDAVVQQHYRGQQGFAPAPQGQPAQQGGRDREVQRPIPVPAPVQQGTAPPPRGKPPQQGGREVQRPTPVIAPAPAPAQQGAAPPPQGKPPQQGSREVQRPTPVIAPTPAPAQQGAAPAPQGQPAQQGARAVPKPVPVPAPAPAPALQGAAPAPYGQPPQQGGREVQRPAPAPTPTQQGAAPNPYRQPPQQGARDIAKPTPMPTPVPQGGQATVPQKQPPVQPAPPNEQQAPKPQGQDKGQQGKGRADDPKQGQDK